MRLLRRSGSSSSGSGGGRLAQLLIGLAGCGGRRLRSRRGLLAQRQGLGLLLTRELRRLRLLGRPLGLRLAGVAVRGVGDERPRAHHIVHQHVEARAHIDEDAVDRRGGVGGDLCEQIIALHGDEDLAEGWAPSTSVGATHAAAAAAAHGLTRGSGAPAAAALAWRPLARRAASAQSASVRLRHRFGRVATSHHAAEDRGGGGRRHRLLLVRPRQINRAEDHRPHVVEAHRRIRLQRPLRHREHQPRALGRPRLHQLHRALVGEELVGAVLAVAGEGKVRLRLHLSAELLHAQQRLRGGEAGLAAELDVEGPEGLVLARRQQRNRRLHHRHARVGAAVVAEDLQ